MRTPRLVPTIAALLLIAACGGTSATTRPSAAVTDAPIDQPTSEASEPAGTGGESEADRLCALLGGSDFGQFGFVTAAEPDVSSDGEGSAYCEYANGVFLEVYVHETEDEATATYETILENAPMDGQEVDLGPGEAQVDTQIGDDSAGIAVRAGRMAFTIGLPASEQVEAQLTTLAGLVLQRAVDLV